MNRKLLSISCMSMLFVTLLAQTSDNAINEINTIKLNSNFITAESTVKDWETAYDNAKVLLTKEIEQWLLEQGASNIAGVIAICNEHVMEIKTTRGSLYRAFVYINKSDIYPYMDKSKLMIVEIDETNESVPTAIIADNSMGKKPTIVLTDQEKEMLDIRGSADIQPFVMVKKEADEILSYGKYSTLPEDGCSYIFIYDQNGNVPACLRYENGIALNLATGKEEIISEQYKGCGGIWIKLKQPEIR